MEVGQELAASADVGVLGVLFRSGARPPGRRDLKKGLVFDGDVLNTGARIQRECTRLERRLVSSADRVDRLDLPDEWTAEAMGSVTLRGKSEPTELVAFA